MIQKPIHSNQCKHDIYLGNDNKSDFYLYLNDKGLISICRRFGSDLDSSGEYETIMFDSSLTNRNGHQLLEKLKKIIKKEKEI